MKPEELNALQGTGIESAAEEEAQRIVSRIDEKIEKIALTTNKTYYYEELFYTSNVSAMAYKKVESYYRTQGFATKFWEDYVDGYGDCHYLTISWGPKNKTSAKKLTITERIMRWFGF